MNNRFRVDRSYTLLMPALLVFLGAGISAAGTVSYTGTLTANDDTFQLVVSLSSPGSITLQTWGFGGGTNYAGTPIPTGGFDPLVALFSGTGSSAVMIDGTSDIITNYDSYIGCPPASKANISDRPTCGDITMTFGATAGTYTILLSDAAYTPLALYGGGTLGDGFSDLTGGSLPFYTCINGGDICGERTANWALDVTIYERDTTPEPATVCLAGAALLSLALRRKFQSQSKQSQKETQS